MTLSSQKKSPIWAILPVKRIDAAKQRLSEVFSATERQELFCNMLEDTLAAIRGAKSLHGLLVVTRDDGMRSLTDRMGARLLVTEADEGQSIAVAAAARFLSDEGIQNIITLPGDVPLMTASEIDTVCTSIGDSPSMTIVPNSDQSGSNSIACSPPCAIPFAFGEMSFRRHLHAAKNLGIPAKVLRLPGMALDIDVVSDIVELLDYETTTATQRYLVDSGIAERLRSQGHIARAGQYPATSQRAI